jgi:hypothetical protein
MRTGVRPARQQESPRPAAESPEHVRAAVRAKPREPVLRGAERGTLAARPIPPVALPQTRSSRIEVHIGRVEVRRPRAPDPAPRTLPPRSAPNGASRSLSDLAAARRYVDRTAT